MSSYTDFIAENTAPKGAKRIGIYNKNGNRTGYILLGNLLKSRGQKLYSFGAISDVHIPAVTTEEDFQRALTFLNENEDVAFTCIVGDLTSNGADEELARYKEIVDEFSADTPVYAMSGNHEAYTTGYVTSEQLLPYTGQPLYYSFEYQNDVYIMLGTYSEQNDGAFTVDELQFLYDTLETNRNKRCFVFEHVFTGNSGNPLGLYLESMLSGVKGDIFQSLLKHYKNIVLFHGHSHTKFYLQELEDNANYSETAGYKSVHIPSVAIPRDIVDGELMYTVAGSEGYVVDVYENGIHLRGRDFVKGEYLPIASYWIDTTLQTIEANTYVDSTGTIIT